MLIEILFITSRFLTGTLLTLSLVILLESLGGRRGLASQLVTIVLLVPLLSLVLLLCSTESNASRNGLPFLERSIQFITIAIPILLVAQMAERYRLGGVRLSDYFRLTAAVSVTLFVYNALGEASVSGIYSIVAFTLTFLMGEKAAKSRQVGRNTALAFACGFLLAVGANPLFYQLGTREYLYLVPEWKLQEPAGFLALVAIVAGIVVTPAIARGTLLRSRALHRLLFSWIAWRFSFAKPSRDMHAACAADLWHFRRGTCFLNHGSFGAVPLLLRDRQAGLQATVEDQPMDFLARQVEGRWLDARFELATWLGTRAENIAFCENATAGMNEIAAWFPLDADDEVLLNDHEYGAVHRIWQRRCQRSGARLVIAKLPQPLEKHEDITQAILDACTSRTKLVVISHITSPTAVILPVEDICRRMKDRKIAVCVDGPHALLQESVHLGRLDCDFYTASCHKWLCAPRGSGFVFIDPKWHAQVEPVRLSWGRLPPTDREQWWDELIWTGTRDYSAYLTVPAAIRFFQALDRERIDARNHRLACYAREKLLELPGAEPVTPAGRHWFGWMVGVWLPDGNHGDLQQRLFETDGIEVPIVHFGDRFLVRVSCHLYNHSGQIDQLYRSLVREISRGKRAE